MISQIRALIRSLVIKWVGLVISRPRLVLLAGLFITSVSALYSVQNLGVITDTSVMLSKDLGYLKVYRHFKKEFPHSYNQIVIVLEGLSPDLAMDARDRLAAALRKKPKMFPWVYMPGDDTFFKKNGLLFLSVDELERLADSLAAAQPILASLVERTDIASFFNVLADALIELRKGQQFGLKTVFQELDRTFEALEQGRFYQMSWVRLMAGKKQHRSMQLILVQPNVSYESLLPGKEAIGTIKDMARRLNLTPSRGVNVMLTGDIPMQYDELRSVTKGAKLAGILSLFMVSIVLLTGLGSLRLVVATLVPLVMGLILTASFATAVIGHLNMISVAFAVLFIGLGVDYAIHFCLRYRELLFCGFPSPQALLDSAKDVGPSLVLCAITTSIGFYSFMPTDFSGVAELGLISGTGMFIALFCNFTFLPAVISLFPLQTGRRQRYYITSDRHPLFLKMIAWPYKKARILRLVAVIVTISCLFFVPRVRFDSNPINLRDPDAESIKAFKKLLKDPNGSPWSLESLAKDRIEAKEKRERFSRLDLVRHAIDLTSFIPEDQEEKLEIISDMEMILGPILDARIQVIAGPWDRQIGAMLRFNRELARTLPHLDQETGQVATDLVERSKRFVIRLERLGPDEGQRELQALSQAILGSFPGRIRELQLAMSASTVTLDSLPKDLVSEWVGRYGSWRVEVVPKKNPKNDQEIMAFIKEARSVDRNVTGYPVLIMEGGRIVVRAFKQAFSYSLVSIFLLLLMLMPKKKDAFLILYSLSLAGLLSATVMVILDLPLNFANIIALPLILGIGVDNGIHIVHRHRQALERPSSLLQTSTARAIFFSTLTTICSFGNLAVSPHLGMSSMGKLLTIGIFMTLVTSMFFIPAFLSSSRNNDQKESRQDEGP